MNNPSASPIDEMNQLIEHISSFENLLNKTEDFKNPAFIKEYELFCQFIKFRTQDFNLASLKELNLIANTHLLK